MLAALAALAGPTTVATAVMGTSLAGFTIAVAVFVAVTAAFSLATPRVPSVE